MQLPGQGQVDFGDYNWARPKTITLPGNTTITRSYDALLRTTAITAMDGVNNQLMLRGYEYSPVGNVVEKLTEHGIYTYSYDAMSRLTRADNPELPGGFQSIAASPAIADEEFTYDALGNRVTDNAVPGVITYNLNNELTSIGGESPAYDLNGNTTENPRPGMPQRYVYDATKRLKQILDAEQNVVAEYYYDPFGRRLWKEVAGVRTYFLYANEGLIAEFDDSGTETRSYGYLPGSPWSTNPLYQKVNGSYYWYINDHLGTPQKMIATSGEVVWAARYDSFGNAVIDVEDVRNNLGFPGQYFDAESGLYYNWNRYYDPVLGRYLQSDPLGLDAGMNFYVYANSNPVNLVDPMGLSTGSYQHGLDDRDEMPDGTSRAERNENGQGNGYSRGTIGKLDNIQDVIDNTRRREEAKKTPDHLNPVMWAKEWAADIMRRQGYPNPFAEPEPQNYVEATKPNPAPLSVDDIIDNIVKNKYEPFKADPFNFFDYDPEPYVMPGPLKKVSYDYSDWKKGVEFGVKAASYVAFKVTKRQLIGSAISYLGFPVTTKYHSLNVVSAIGGTGYAVHGNITIEPELSSTLLSNGRFFDEMSGISNIKADVFNNQFKYE